LLKRQPFRLSKKELLRVYEKYLCGFINLYIKKGGMRALKRSFIAYNIDFNLPNEGKVCKANVL
jgi:hypothetical protein